MAPKIDQMAPNVRHKIALDLQNTAPGSDLLSSSLSDRSWPQFWFIFDGFWMKFKGFSHKRLKIFIAFLQQHLQNATAAWHEMVAKN